MNTNVTTSMTDDPASLNACLEALDAAGRVRLLAERFRGRLLATTSFGLQSSVMLHLFAEHAPEVPVVFIDTGYLFKETYRYAQQLEEQLGFTARVFQPRMTAARQEALHGELWNQGRDGLDEYARLNKIEPLNRALQELRADVWVSGLRRAQSGSRSSRALAEQQSKTLKVYPIIDWDDETVARYMQSHGLPQHPLAGTGYVTMGDWHSTQPVHAVDSHEKTRFNGEKYECGLHLDSGVQDFQI